MSESCAACSHEGYTFECAHCGKSVCKTHWVPEDHDCDSSIQIINNQSSAQIDTEERLTPQPVDPSDIKVRSNQTESAVGPSPDVALDGSIDHNTENDWPSKSNDNRGFLKFQISLEAVYISAKAYVKYLISLAGLALLIVGCYNIFSPIAPIGYAFTMHHVLQPVLIAGETNAFPIFVSDVGLIAGGAILAWHS